MDNISAQNVQHYQYKGIEYCASCHNDAKTGLQQYTTWKNSLHSVSYLELATKKSAKYAQRAGIEDNPQNNIICLRCHVTSAGLETSYYTTTYRKEDGVTCEACHKVKEKSNTIIPPESSCLNCHNNSVHRTRKFIFNKKFQKIAHPTTNMSEE